jgi:hypothetical protein
MRVHQVAHTERYPTQTDGKDEAHTKQAQCGARQPRACAARRCDDCRDGRLCTYTNIVHTGHPTHMAMRTLHVHGQCTVHDLIVSIAAFVDNYVCGCCGETH